MKILAVFLTVAAVLLTLSLPAPAGAVDPRGQYRYIRSRAVVRGGCFPSGGSQGVVVIKLNTIPGGRRYMLHILHPCRPPAICFLDGECHGINCKFEGLGAEKNKPGWKYYTLRLRFAYGDAAGRGRIEHHYSGLNCYWDFRVVLKNLHPPQRKPRSPTTGGTL
jgi:hypothetical protein